MNVYLRTKSTVSFLRTVTHNDSITPDTTYLVEMKLSNSDIDPHSTGANVGGLSNYYFGPIVAENVKAYKRVVYPETIDSTEVHFYYGPTGPRMAIIMRPGAIPSDVKLTFSGQDSINIDWQGALRLYMQDKYVKLDQAIAYQVNGLGDIVPVSWLPQYVHESGNVTVGFEYDTYNPAWPLIFLVGYPAMPPPPGPGTIGNLGWSTHAPSPFGNELTSVEVDAQGNSYTCGYSTNFFYPLELGTTVFPPWEPELASSSCGVTMKFLKDTKLIQWGTYIGGLNEGVTRAHKLALYPGANNNLKYAFITGSTTSDDFVSWTTSSSAFVDAFREDHVGGESRMWIAACRMSDGIRHWATTHGQPGPERTWSTHGLAVAIDQYGRLTVGGMIEKGFNTDVPDFPLVTPSGAFSRALGDGFLVSFATDFTIEWSTALLEYSEDGRYGRINDLRATITDGDQKGVWAVGASVYGTNEPLDLVPPPTGGYYQEIAGQLSAVIMQIDLNNHQIVYCTRWGSPGTGAGSSALAVHETRDFVYVGGFTQAFDLTTTQCPPAPSGTLVLNTHTNSTNSDQISDGFILRFKRYSGYQLDYGSLYGGDRDDIILDINGDGNGNIYLTGESRSSGGLSFNTPGNLYLQWPLTEWNKRDAFIVGIRDAEYPGLFWNSAFGGTKSDRGWGIAASIDEVYLCGATGSNYFNDFPLLEWNTDPNDPNSLVDWYYDVTPDGVTQELVPWMTFFQAMDYDVFGLDVFIEGLNSWHVGFISSFNMNSAVALPDRVQQSAQLVAWPLADQSGYLVHLPNDDEWSVDLYDTRGRVLQPSVKARRLHLLHLTGFTPGLYLLKAHRSGEVHTIKLLRP